MNFDFYLILSKGLLSCSAISLGVYVFFRTIIPNIRRMRDSDFPNPTEIEYYSRLSPFIKASSVNKAVEIDRYLMEFTDNKNVYFEDVK